MHSHLLQTEEQEKQGKRALSSDTEVQTEPAAKRIHIQCNDTAIAANQQVEAVSTPHKNALNKIKELDDVLKELEQLSGNHCNERFLGILNQLSSIIESDDMSFKVKEKMHARMKENIASMKELLEKPSLSQANRSALKAKLLNLQAKLVESQNSKPSQRKQRKSKVILEKEKEIANLKALNKTLEARLASLEESKRKSAAENLKSKEQLQTLQSEVGTLEQTKMELTKKNESLGANVNNLAAQLNKQIGEGLAQDASLAQTKFMLSQLRLEMKRTQCSTTHNQRIVAQQTKSSTAEPHVTQIVSPTTTTSTTHIERSNSTTSLKDQAFLTILPGPSASKSVEGVEQPMIDTSESDEFAKANTQLR